MAEPEFEAGLGEGLRRWAEAGEPTFDLEAAVRRRAGRRRRLVRWLAPVATAAALVLGVGLSFPRWAGAAANWPLVGPVVTQIIMKDAGLKWAYDNGLLQGTLAEAKDGDVTVSILGLVADPVQTTVIYQITGLPQGDPSARRPAMASDHGLIMPPPPSSGRPEITFGRVPGQQSSYTSMPIPVQTPVGLVGTIGGMPLGVEAGDLELAVQFGERRVPLVIHATRAPFARFSREVQSGARVEKGGVAVTLDSVIYTPTSVMVRYREEKPEPGGFSTWDAKDMTRLEGPHGSSFPSGGWAIGGQSYSTFPLVAGPTRLVIPMEVKGTPAHLSWSLAQDKGVSHAVAGTNVTLLEWQQDGRTIAFHLQYGRDTALMGLNEFTVLAADGRSYPLMPERSGIGSGDPDQKVVDLVWQSELPAGVEPVAMQINRISERVDGPWVFDLPR